jgi:drug/metabolite transporter (DMT)-like permease
LDVVIKPRVSAGRKSPRKQERFAVEAKVKPAQNKSVLIGILCGTAAAFGWAAGFVIAKHGISVGFSPADLAFHRFFWSGLVMLPLLLVRDGIKDLGGFGWPRGLVVSVLSGPPQALLAYSGFILVPLGHGTTIQPACAALFGIILASAVLGEHLTIHRIVGAVVIIAGLIVFGFESLTTIGTHGVGGDLLFALAGLFWATFGILLRHWRLPGLRAIAVVGALSLLIYAPFYVLFVGFANLLRLGWAENLLQAAVQGLLAGMLPIYLFARAVTLIGAGRASTFPALVPGFGLIIGYLALGVVPTIAQLVGLVIVVIGFRFVVK